jgi:hypothetical protein
MKKINLFALTAILLLTALNTKAQKPGGVSTPGYTWMAWLTPDSYDNGTWTNLITGTGTVGDFTKQDQPPVKIDNGYNFHPSVNFPDRTSTTNLAAPHWMLSANNTPGTGIALDDNMTVITVMKHSTTNSY